MINFLLLRQTIALLVKKNKHINRKAGCCLVGLFLCYLLLPVNQVKAQYMVSGEVLEVEYLYNDVVVELRNSNSKRKIEISADGQFITSLNWGTVYFFSFKKPGYVSKIIEFSTHLPVDKNSESIAPYHLPVRLFKIFEGVDTVFFKNAVAKIKYDANLGDFSDDRDYSLKVKYKIDKMRQEGVIKTKPNKKSMPEQPNINVGEKKGVVEKETITKSNNDDDIDKTVGNEIVIPFQEVKDIPPLKQSYPDGESNEEFELKGRITSRTIFTFKGQRRVFLSVKHEWGGLFYFIDEADIGYRCISREVYNLSLQKYRTIINNNK